jgi:hypothetical protein
VDCSATTEASRARRARPGQRGLVCPCSCVWFVTIAGGGGYALLRGCYAGSPQLGLPPLGFVSLRQWATVRRRWWLRDCGGTSWWAVRLAELGGVSGAMGLWGREKSLSDGRHRRGDARGRHHSFLRGIGASLSHYPSAYRGKP